MDTAHRLHWLCSSSRWSHGDWRPQLHPSNSGRTWNEIAPAFSGLERNRAVSHLPWRWSHLTLWILYDSKTDNFVTLFWDCNVLGPCFSLEWDDCFLMNRNKSVMNTWLWAWKSGHQPVTLPKFTEVSFLFTFSSWHLWIQEIKYFLFSKHV